jgi:hypothetical protein
VHLARSSDGGTTFAPAALVHEDGLSGARGWASVAVDATGTAHVVWLVGRHATPAPARPPTGHAHGGSMRQDVVHASWRPDGTTDERLVESHVCFCCKTSVAAGPGGDVYLAWRHVYPTNLRDIAVSRSTDGGRTFGDPVRVHEDGWQLNGCPEDGPAIALDDAGRLHIVWPTMTGEGANAEKALFYSSSTDGGRTFAPRVRLDGSGAGVAAHPQLASAGDGVLAVWDERDGDGTRILVRGPVTGDPASVSTRVVAEGTGLIYPAVAWTGAAAIVAWSDAGGSIRVQRISW